jgi:pimeloyl-ACP methyl ester carboxylesterase
MMPSEHGRRLAELLPAGRLVEITDSYTVVPLDQPGKLADAVRAFITSTASHRR